MSIGSVGAAAAAAAASSYGMYHHHHHVHQQSFQVSFTPHHACRLSCTSRAVAVVAFPHTYFVTGS